MPLGMTYFQMSNTPPYIYTSESTSHILPDIILRTHK